MSCIKTVTRKINTMKRLSTFFLAIGLASLIGCSDVNFKQVEDNPIQVKELFSFNFENNSEGFVAHRSGDYTEGTPVTNAKDATDPRCGILFRGKTEDFTVWKGYDFKGNNTQFMGLDMGSCKGVFTSVVETNFELQSDLNQGKAKLEFKYYMPGNFTGWGNKYKFNVYISKKGSINLEDAVAKFEVSENPQGWVDFSKDVAVALKAGSYKLLVQIVGSSAAIDDIKLVETTTN